MVDIDCNDEVVLGAYGTYLFYFFIMAQNSSLDLRLLVDRDVALFSTIQNRRFVHPHM